MHRIGVDVGGTFTDFTMFDENSGRIAYHKVPSTPTDPSEAIQQGVAEMLAAYGVTAADVGHFGHGTTVATNMVIEHRGAATGLLTTKGFRDVLEIGRQTRPHLYDYSVGKPPPLVPRQHRLEVAERVGADGTILMPMDENNLRAAVAALKTSGVEAVAVCFLHAYKMPGHERTARAELETQLPDVYISLSSEVLPEFREYERLSSTVINAYVGPRMGTYLSRFLDRVRDLGITIEPYTFHSNGGLMSVRTVRQHPVRTCLSGPAAGVVGAVEVGRAAGFPNLVTFDVGGTSTDVSLIYDSRPLFTSSRLVADYPIKVPMIDIHVIGAGGGSIAWMDDAGALKVGPHSAGAEPGPVGYGRGGLQPTITDANLTLQRLNPVALLEGRMPVELEAARQVIFDKVAKPLNLKLETAAHGIIRIANANMSRAIRSVSTERGYDLSEFALFAYGGAGPLHAAEIAVECQIPRVVVPQEPGTMCARGMLLSDISLDFVRTEITPADTTTWVRVCRLFDDMLVEGCAWLENERVESGKQSFHRVIDARYQGQNFEVKVEMDQIEPGDLAMFHERFRAAHRQEYGYDIPDRTIEIVNCRLQAVGAVARASLFEIQGGGTLSDAAIDERQIYISDQHGWVPTPVYARAKLPVGETIIGPAIIEEMSATTVMLPGQSAVVDEIGNIIIDVGLKSR